MPTFKLLLRTVAAIAGVGLVLSVCGCKEKSSAEKTVEKTEAVAKDAGESIKDAANKTGKAVEDTAEKVWDGIKEGAHEVSKAATNVAGELK